MDKTPTELGLKDCIKIYIDHNISCISREAEFDLNNTKKAKSLLRKTDMPINSIANAVGYADQLAFSKIFKQRYGVSPKTYRDKKEELVIKSAKGEYESKCDE